MIPLRYAPPSAELLAICLLLGLVAAAPFARRRMFEIGDTKFVWEGSAAAGVWLHPDGYLDFRKYSSAGLSDLGFRDHQNRKPLGVLVLK